MTEANRSATEDESGRPVVLGRLSGLYGVRGWFRVFSYTEPRDALLEYDPWLLQVGGRWREAAVLEARTHGRTLVAQLAGIEDRDAAVLLVGAEIAVPRERLPATEPGQYYWTDLVGLEVRHRDGRVLGTLDHMLATGAHDVMVVRARTDLASNAEAGSREILIPFVPERFVLDVDLAAGVVEVDWEWD